MNQPSNSNVPADDAFAELVKKTIADICLGNNGYADFALDDKLAAAVQDAGYVVIVSKDIFNRKSYRGFTKCAQENLRHEPFGVSTNEPPSQSLSFAEEPDYEGMILARQEREMMDY
ncbi:hypothetical protein [Paraburkholderia youngii]|uniref:hypothetical protein n=1 Tax=Paraburkholderia youngii TaxID=2782701 RepID=UPI003D1EDF3A